MYYVLLFIAYISALLFAAPVYFALCLVIALRFRGYWCLLVAALIDMQFVLVASVIPLYTLGTIVILLVAEIMRPRLRIDVAV